MFNSHVFQSDTFLGSSLGGLWVPGHHVSLVKGPSTRLCPSLVACNVPYSVAKWPVVCNTVYPTDL